MTDDATPREVGSHAGLGPLVEPTAVVTPYSASVRLSWYSTAAAHNAKPGPLYSQAAIDAAVAAERERWREAGWVCKDGFPALLGHKPLKPGAKLYASPDDWA